MKNKYLEISNLIKKDIDNNLFPALRLPTERTLCAKYSAARSTIRAALTVLEEDRIIEKKQGSGIFIRPKYSSSKNKIALILPDADEYLYPKLTNLIKDGLSPLGYSVVVYNTNRSLFEERRILNNILDSSYRAVIVEPTNSNFPSVNSDLFKKLMSKNIPTIFILDQYENLLDFPCIMVDYYNTCRSLFISSEDLISKTSCIFMNNKRSSHQKLLGLFDAPSLNLLGDENPSILFIGDKDIDEIRKGNLSTDLFAFINSDENKDTFICDNDEIAYYIYRNYSFDKNIEIISFDNTYLSKMSHGKIKSHGPDLSELTESIKDTLLKALTYPLNSLGDIPCVFLKTTLK